MFGYVYPSKIDLTFRDYFKFKGYYCGLCKTIKKQFGNVERICVNYDVTFLGILLSAIYNDKESISYESCFLNPIKKKRIIYNEYIEYSANINILLAYHKLKDNYIDDDSKVALVGMKLFKNSYQKAKQTVPNKEKVVCNMLEKIHSLEKSDETRVEEISDVFGQLLGELSVYKEDYNYAEQLKKIGFYIGKFIYILDCYDDLPQDIKKKRFNPLIKEDKQEIENKIREMLDNILEKLQKEIEKLELKQSKQLINNIIKLGLRNKVDIIFKIRKQKEVMIK